MRPQNQKAAFTKLAKLLIAHYSAPDAERRTDGERVRNYHAVRNEVLDEASRLRMPYSEVVDGCNIGPMIDARRMAISTDEDLERPNKRP